MNQSAAVASRSCASHASKEEDASFVRYLVDALRCDSTPLCSSSRLIASLSTTVVTLRLEDSYLGDSGIKRLSACIPDMMVLRAIGLRSNGIRNEGAVSLCAALDTIIARSRTLSRSSTPGESGCDGPRAPGPSRSEPRIAVLDLRGNFGITRIGGQALLNSASRCGSLAFCLLGDTRVTEYFERRIRRHCELHLEKAPPAEQEEMRALVEPFLAEGRATSTLHPQDSLVDAAAAATAAGGDARAVTAFPPTTFSPPPPTTPGDARTDASAAFATASSTPALDQDPRGAPSPSGVAAVVALRAQCNDSKASTMDSERVVSRLRHSFERNCPFDEAWWIEDPDDCGEEEEGDNDRLGGSAGGAVVAGVRPHSRPSTGTDDFVALATMAQPPLRAPSRAPLDAPPPGGGLRPHAPSLLEHSTTVLHAATPDFDGLLLLGDDTGAFTINHLPQHQRTMYGWRTPTPFGVIPTGGCTGELLTEVFRCIEAYVPRDIELPTKFLFPGKIDFFPAVHCPDSMLHPPPPSELSELSKLFGAAGMPDFAPAQRKYSVAQGEPCSEEGDDACAEDASPVSLGGAPPRLMPVPPSIPSLDVFEGANTNIMHNTDAVGAEATPPPAAVGLAPLEGLSQPSVWPATNSMYWNFFATTTAAQQRQQQQQQEHQQLSQPLLSQQSNGAAVVSSFPSDLPATPSHSDSVAPNQTESAANSVIASVATPAAPAASRPAVTATSLPFASVASQLYARHTLFRVNDRILGNTHTANKRSLAVTANPPVLARGSQRSLCELLHDPLWAPHRPIRDQQVTDYCVANKLRFNTVSQERKRPSALESREFYLERLIKHSLTERLTSGSLNPKGTLLATSSYDMTCKVWDLESGKKIWTFRGHTGHLSDCLWTGPRGETIITASFDATLMVWDVESGKALRTLRGHELEVVAVACDNSGTLCASGGMDDLAIVWDIAKGCERFILSGHTAEVVALQFSPRSDLLASGSTDENVRVWKMSDGTCLHFLNGHRGEVGQVKFNCWGNVLLSGSADGCCRLWDMTTGDSKVLRGHTQEVIDCDFSPDGWLCTSASEDGTARVWDVLSGGCLTMFVGHTAGVCRAMFNKDGREVITSSADTTARVWSTETGACKQVLKGHRGVVVVGYNANSERLMTLSKDNTCRIWRLEPPAGSLLAQTALAICQFPTLYAEVAKAEGLPKSVLQTLARAHRKVFPAVDRADMLTGVASPSRASTSMGDTSGLVGTTPLPQLSSPDLLVEDDDRSPPSAVWGAGGPGAFVGVGGGIGANALPLSEAVQSGLAVVMSDVTALPTGEAFQVVTSV